MWGTRVRFLSMAQSRGSTAVRVVLGVFIDTLRLLGLALRSHAQLAAENLFLRKQLALYVERQVKPRRADDSTRITLVALSSLIEWRRMLTVVQPATLTRWHRKGFQLLCRGNRSLPGDPVYPPTCGS